MGRISTASLLAGCAFALLGGCATETGQTFEPLRNEMLSHGGAVFSAAVPEMAIDPANPQRVAVIWRYLSMENANQPGVQRGFECHLSLSTDGGRTFAEQKLDWGTRESKVCNSPFVDIGPNGELLIGATLTGILPQDAPEGSHAFGQVGMRISRDWGASWSATKGLITSDDGALFAPNSSVPEDATKVPWDGGHGVIDQDSGAIVISGGFPAPPGEDLYSQRFYTVSEDGGAQWGPIRAFGSAAWPQRWDGALVSAHGTLAYSYLADAVPPESGKDAAECLCIVFATSKDGGKTVERHLVAETKSFDRLVHYPPIAADPLAEGRYALAHVEGEAAVPVVRLTGNGGETWQIAAAPAAPAAVIRASRPAIAYAPDGKLVLFWRGYHADGSYDAYMAAAADGKSFGPALKVSSAPSPEPSDYLKDYSVTGDFISAVAAGPDVVHAAWSDWRSSESGQIAYVRIPFARLLAGDEAQ